MYQISVSQNTVDAFLLIWPGAVIEVNGRALVATYDDNGLCDLQGYEANEEGERALQAMLQDIINQECDTLPAQIRKAKQEWEKTRNRTLNEHCPACDEVVHHYKMYRGDCQRCFIRSHIEVSPQRSN